MNNASTIVIVIQIPTENYDQASNERNNKKRGDVIIILVRAFEIKNFNPRVNYQIEKYYSENRI
jgi:hypothetical protein